VARNKRVVIVGGGMMGVGLLYGLAEMGWTDTILIEKGELTSGSTWHAAGLCASFLGQYNIARVHHVGNQLYPKLEAMTGQYTGWHGCGSMRIATTKEEVDWFKQVQGFSRNIGFRMEIIGPDEIRKLNPLTTLDGMLAGAWTLDDGYVDPSGCCQAMATAARKLGAEIMRSSRVTAIKQNKDGTWLVESEKGDFIAEHVVNAAGCYAREVGKMVGLNVPVVNMEHQYIVTEKIEEFEGLSREIPVFRDTFTAGYYRQEHNGALIGIYEHEGSVEAWSALGGSPEWSSSSELFPGDLDRISSWLDRTMERMPVFAKAGIKRVVNGAIPHTPDGNPLLGPAAGLKNFWMCCGSFVGIAQGAGSGRYLAQWMIEGESEINMKDFDPRRFGPYADQDYTRAKSIQDYHHMFVTHLPGEERHAARPTRFSPLFEKLRSKGCVHTQGGGYERPKWFSLDGREEQYGFRRNNIFEVVAAECWAVANRVGVCDLSSFAKFEVSGPDAEAFLDRTLANRLPKKIGGIKLAHLLTENGRIETEFTVTRLASDKFYLLSSIGAEFRDLDFLTKLREENESVRIEDVTDQIGVLVVAGPKSRELIGGLTDSNLENTAFSWLTMQEIDISGIRLRAMRVNFVGELGWELHVPMNQLLPLYDAIWLAGLRFGIADFGLYAINSLRMEKAYRSWGDELTNEINMVEADMERFLSINKGPFCGRSATHAALAKGIKQKLVYLDIQATDSDVRGAEPVYQEGRVVGVTTSGAYGHRTGLSLAFAYVSTKLAASGTLLTIEILGEQIPAVVLEAPVYDPTNERLSSLGVN
jgi:dimethylglycine dehydrogenase